MKLKAHSLTDLGNVRTNNEDSFLADIQRGLFAVADGMGGRAAGEVASACAVQVVAQVVARNQQLIASYDRNPSIELSDNIQKILNGAVQEACAEVFRRSLADPALKGMGTTLTALLVQGRTGFIAHVGDSSIHLLRRGEIHKLTTDHSLVQEKLDRGQLTPEEAGKASFKNILTRAVGTQEYVEVDTLPVNLMDSDLLILSSDGLTNYVRDTDMKELAGRSSLENLPQELIQLAKQRGGHDNITAVILHLDAGDEKKSEASTDQRIAILRQIPLFNYLDADELQCILGILKMQSFQDGTKIIKEGTPGDDLYMILQGRVAIYRKEQFLGELGRGSHFGEMALVDNNPRSATIVAISGTTVLCINRRDLFHLMKSEPLLSVKLLWNLSHMLSLRLRATNDDLIFTRHALDHEQEKFKRVFWEGVR